MLASELDGGFEGEFDLALVDLIGRVPFAIGAVFGELEYALVLGVGCIDVGRDAVVHDGVSGGARRACGDVSFHNVVLLRPGVIFARVGWYGALSDDPDGTVVLVLLVLAYGTSYPAIKPGLLGRSIVLE